MIISKQAHVISLHLSWSSESFISLITSLILHLFTLISVFPPLVLWESYDWWKRRITDYLLLLWAFWSSADQVTVPVWPQLYQTNLQQQLNYFCFFVVTYVSFYLADCLQHIMFQCSVFSILTIRLFQILQKSESASKNDTPVISLSLLHWAAQSCDLSPISNFGAMCSASFEPDAVTKNHCWSSWCS